MIKHAPLVQAVVPISDSSNGIVTEFLTGFVPFCIHSPVPVPCCLNCAALRPLQTLAVEEITRDSVNQRIIWSNN